MLRAAAVALLVTAITWGCSSEPFDCGMGAACPALAEVDGLRYSISGAEVLESIGRDLLVHGVISTTNSPGRIAGNQVFSVAGIEPMALLVGVAANPADRTHQYVLLFGPAAGAYPALCQYLTEEQRNNNDECAVPV